MKRLILILFSIIFLLILGYSQESYERETKPEEPELVLPPVILNIEDLVVEKVEAGLPEDEELLPPEREIKLPDVSELKIEEPVLKGEVNIPGINLKSKTATGLKAEGTLGVGSMNHILSSIALYKLGETPRFKLSFDHETLDGFGFHPAGSGYSFRSDKLEGFFRAEKSSLRIDANGSFEEHERGFQGKSSYISSIDRFVKTDLNVSKNFNEKFSLEAYLTGKITSFLLAGNTPTGVNEYLVSPSLKTTVKFGKIRTGLNAKYDIRNYAVSTIDQRFQADAFLKLDLPYGITTSFDAGWFWSSLLNHNYVFDVSISGSPVESVNLFLEGGHKVRVNNLSDVLGSLIITDTPNLLQDDPGWFVSSNIKISILKNLIFSFGINTDWYSAMPDLTIVSTGSLFQSTLIQRTAFRLTSKASIRWNINEAFTLISRWKREFADRPKFDPLDNLSLEIIAEEPNGDFGGNITMKYLTGFTSYLQPPEVNLGGFYRLSESLRFMIKLEDLIEMPGLHRYNVYTLEEPGFRGSVEMQLNF